MNIPTVGTIDKIRVGELRTRYWQAGSGPDLILLHGFPETLLGWADVMPQLANRYRVHAVDLPGMGQADAPVEGHYHPLAYTDFLQALLEALEIKRAHLLGVDLGMPPVLFFAAHHPERVGRIIVGDGPGLYRPHLRGPVVRALTHPLGSRILPLLFRLFPRFSVLRTFRYCRGRMPTSDLINDFQATMTRPHVIRGAFASILKQMKDLEQRLPAIQCPVLAMWGRHDNLILPGMGEALVQALPSARLAVVEDAGHFVHHDQPTRFADLVLDFLT